MANQGEESNPVEKITPKDLVMFSPRARSAIAKKDFNYLGIDYDIQVPEQPQNHKVWGIPFVDPAGPVPLGIVSGAFMGTIFNVFRKRPHFSNIHVHVGLSLFSMFAIHQGYQAFENWRFNKEMVVWDYVKKYPEDFPEVFNPPKKFKDMLIEWKPVR